MARGLIRESDKSLGEITRGTWMIYSSMLDWTVLVLVPTFLHPTQLAQQFN